MHSLEKNTVNDNQTVTSEENLTISVNQDKDKKISYEKLYAENEKRKNTISTVNAILNENPELKRQFILAKKQYELKQNGDIAKTAPVADSQKLPPKNKHTRH